MLIGLRRGSRSVQPTIGAMLAASVLVVLAVLPAMASSGPTRLSNPAVSPRAGTTSTTFVFTVHYRNREGSSPDHVNVVVDGTGHAMTATSSDWKHGVTFTWSSKFPVGTHAVNFDSIDRDKFADSMDGGSISVSAPPTPKPAATPAPTPKPTPKATPQPTPKHQPTPAPAPASTPRPVASPPPTAASSSPATTPAPSATPGFPGGVGGNSGTGGSTAWVGGGGPAHGSDGSGGSAGSNGGLDGGGSGAGSVSGAGTVDNPATNPGGALGGTGGLDQTTTDHAFAADPSTRTWGDLTRYLSALGLDGTNVPTLRLLPALIGSVGGVTMMMAFLFFGKRRRDGEPPAPDEVLAAKAARGTGIAASGKLVAEPRTPAPLPEPDAQLPRWRRPSLLEARKADPLRSATGIAAPLTFDHGIVSAVEGYERRLIRYATVRLLDAPDELRSAEIGSLGQDDEVQLIERSGTYWLVLCPDGRQGWIHKMTLGDIVGEPASPSAKQTWAASSLDAGDVDDDVLAAFMAARGQA